MKTRVKLLITLAAGLVGLTVAEIAARSNRPPFQPPSRIDGELLQPSPDPRLRFEARPGGSARIVYWGADGMVEREVVAHVNSQGFRGPLVEEEPPPDVVRIAAIGDSHTFGTGVADDEPWPAVLGYALRALPGAPRCQVMNCGVPSLDTEEVMVWFETHVLPYQPDLVVYALFPNDTSLRGLQEESRIPNQGRLMRLCDPNRSGAIGWLRNRSALAETVASGLYHRLLLRRWAESQKVLFAEDFEGWARARKAIAHGRDLARARNARFAMIHFPFFLRVDGRLLSAEANRALKKFCAEEAIPCFDPEPLFDGIDLERLRANARDLHAGPEAHRIVGEGVARWMVTENLLGEGARR